MASEFKACSVDGCNGNSSTKRGGARGFCPKHYHRLRKTGDPLSVSTEKGELMRFAHSVLSNDNADECLIWPFHRHKNGYGHLKVHGKEVIASRYVCELAHGRPPTSKHQAAHSCGKGHEGCVNPRHLSWKTRRENEADKLLHGTLIKGADHALSKLNEDQVREIRYLKDKEMQKTIASRFGISPRHVWMIQRRKRWAWLCD